MAIIKIKEEDKRLKMKSKERIEQNEYKENYCH